MFILGMSITGAVVDVSVDARDSIAGGLASTELLLFAAVVPSFLATTAVTPLCCALPFGRI